MKKMDGMNDMMNKNPMEMQMLSDDAMDSVSGGAGGNDSPAYLYLCDTCKSWFRWSPNANFVHTVCGNKMRCILVKESAIEVFTRDYTPASITDVKII
ncbi:MAG: hypothetical protein J5449_12945 [Oscillospiraceae bacterium]|nr:hypothetical protein [Oscillospiraceae bacterium]